MLHALVLAAADAAKPSKVPFYICGGLLACWAVVLGAIGISHAEFPGGQRGMRGVIGLSVVLMVATMTTAVATA